MQEVISRTETENYNNKDLSSFSKLKNEFVLIEINNNATSSINPKELTEFEKAASKIYFTPISCQENYSGNYDNYLLTTLRQISSIKNLPYEKALSNPELYKNYPSKEIKECLNSDKKLILLDLDETLIHSEHEIKDINIYDTILRFKDNSSDPQAGEYYEIGIFLRNGVQKFLSVLKNYFNIGIFTASDKDYADAIIKYLDPNNNIIKFSLYRENCVNVNDLINIKDLRILKDVKDDNLKKIVLIDNNMYSFSNQLSNGILINSFYGDKNDNELSNVLGYLLEFILPADDIRETNEKIFGFSRILEQIN